MLQIAFPDFTLWENEGKKQAFFLYHLQPPQWRLGFRERKWVKEEEERFELRVKFLQGMVFLWVELNNFVRNGENLVESEWQVREE